ncbi:MAG: tetratricopeptide repeat protein [Calditrichaceae bacterium]|nr:tetratricopeptide repeat protein [Calditrichia bacterium]NUQ42919.1 tetratricopeptide repeat protein [Calditrichaceae bacterium]
MKPLSFMTAKFFALCFLCLFLWYCGASGPKKPREENPKTAFLFYYEAEKDIAAGDFQGALAHLDSAIAYNPRYANFYQVKGWVWEETGRADSAIVAYEKCLAYRSYYPEVWLRLGRVCLLAHQYENAAFYLKKAAQHYPDSADVHLQLGETYYHMNKYPLALDNLFAYRKIAPNPNPLVWKWLGLTYFRMKEFLKAIPPLQQYVSAVPGDETALKSLGIAKFKLGEYNDALTYLNFAADVRDDDAEVYLYRARYFLIVEKPEAAGEQLSIALKIDSLNTDILFEAGVLNYSRENFPESKRQLTTLIRLAPEYWPAYRYLGFLAERENDLAQAGRYYQLYLDHTPEPDPEVRTRMDAIRSQTKKQ